jgi:hypothetical protein
MVLHLLQVSSPDGIEDRKRKLNEKLDVLNKKKHDLVQMLKQVQFVLSFLFWSVYLCLLSKRMSIHCIFIS